jgi:hypothetical protein
MTGAKPISTIKIRVVSLLTMLRALSEVGLPKGPSASTKTGRPSRLSGPRPIPS